MTLNVRVSGPLGDFVAANVSEYVRDLIRRDKERAERVEFERLKAELGAAFAAPDTAYVQLTADELIARNRAHRSA